MWNWFCRLPKIGGVGEGVEYKFFIEVVKDPEYLYASRHSYRYIFSLQNI